MGLYGSLPRMVFIAMMELLSSHIKKAQMQHNSIRENFIFDIALGNDENLYVASFNAGVDVINIRTQEVTHLLSEKKENEEGLPDLWINKIFCDTENNLWIGGQDFLRIYSLKEKKYKNFQLPSNLESDIYVSVYTAGK